MDWLVGKIRARELLSVAQRLVSRGQEQNKVESSQMCNANVKLGF